MNMFGGIYYLSLILASFVATISGLSCRTSYPEARAWIPATWRTIIDTTDYDSLLSSSNPLWIETDANNDGDTFTQTGGVCQRFLFTCPSNFMLDNEDNWVFTQYISYESAREVFYNITYSFGDCRFISGCQTYVTLYRYDSNSAVSMSARTTTSNYQLLTGSATTSQFGTTGIDATSQVRGVARPSNFNGFYLGIRDTGTCGNVQRVLLYYLVCPARVSGLVIFPEVSVPPQTSANTVYSGSCAPNSHAVTSLEVQITSSTSVCTERASGGARCECDGGYYLNNITTCEACSAGEYRATFESHTFCNSCPSNSESRGEASVICVCLSGYYRNSSPPETPAAACTRPPGPVRNLVVISNTSTTVTIRWDRPSSTGGRSDYYYSIKHSDPRGTPSSTITVNKILVNTAATVSYTIPNLLPFETYEIRIITHNGVSGQEPDTKTSRKRKIEATTSESIPGPVTVMNLCSAVIWQAPVNPNGVIWRYEIEIANTVVPLSATQFYFITSDTQREANAVARVRAVNTAGSGSWSQESPICADSSMPPLATSCPMVTTCPICSIPEASTPCPALSTTSEQKKALPPTELETPTPKSTIPKPSKKTTQKPEEKTPPPTPEVITASSPIPGAHFSLNGTVYNNNSFIILEDVGEMDNALLCVSEDNPFCCNRVGEFYYPNGTKVPVNRHGYGFWRNRGKGETTNYIRLNQRPNTLSANGTYRCEIPYGHNLKHKLYISLVSRSKFGNTQALEQK